MLKRVLHLHSNMFNRNRPSAGNLLVRLIGRRRMWRAGRWIYMVARGDSANDIRLNGEEELQRSVLANTVHKQRLVIFDVGANIGDWTLSLLRQRNGTNAAQLIIYAFEPVPITREVLSRRLAESDPTVDLRVIPVALSDGEGTVALYATVGTAGVNSLHEDPRDPQRVTLQVQRRTVDAFCREAGIAHIDFLKCDAEGHDMFVLSGARQLLEEGRISIVQFEYNHRWIFSRHFLKDAFDLVESMPYSVGKLTGHGIELYERWHPELDCFFEGNYVLVHDAHVSRFRCRRGSFDRYNTYVTSGGAKQDTFREDL